MTTRAGRPTLRRATSPAAMDGNLEFLGRIDGEVKVRNR
jgi:hypothetical protein